MTESIYSLKILRTEVAAAEVSPATPDGLSLSVEYQGRGRASVLTGPLASTDVNGILRGCEAIAQRIFHEEFRLNNAVDLHFSLRDDAGLKLWHTSPNLFVKCALDMKMDWTCKHLSRSYNTMVTLGMIELPSEVPLKGTGLGENEIARVIMDSMASGIDFMGNIMMVRDNIDHDAEVRAATVAGRG